MSPSFRLLSHSPSRWKAAQWKPRPLPPLEDVPLSQNDGEERGCQASLQPEPTSREGTVGRSYAALQLWLALVTLSVSLAIALGLALVYSPGVAGNYLLGAMVGVVYLRMLGRSVAELGKTRSRLGVTRLALFVGLMVLAAKVKSLQILPIFFGFMTYKVTLLIYLVQTLSRLSSSS